jgi:Rrf2 family transcriptional regulator, nitric oxide-sensitive transcriptional repressor
MHITTKSLLAVKTLLICAAQPGRQFRKHEIAEKLNASENHLAQVVHQLGRKGFLTTQRGRSGGLRLARPPEEISIGQVLRQFEQGLPLAAACDGGLSRALALAEEAFYRQMDGVSLANLAEQPHAMRIAAE